MVSGESSKGSNSLGYGTGVGGYMDLDPDAVLSYLIVGSYVLCCVYDDMRLIDAFVLERIVGRHRIYMHCNFCLDGYFLVLMSLLLLGSFKDDKLQYVLGNFQKDFEGGVSYENLGTKFGGYGTFLPTYHSQMVKSLKVRIRANSDNLLTRKKEQIYRELGLDVSPSYIHDGNLSQDSGSVHPYSRDQSAPSWDVLNKRDASPMMIEGDDVHNGNLSLEVGGDVRGQAPSIGDMARDNVSQPSGNVHPYSRDQSAPSRDALNKRDASPMMIEGDDVHNGNLSHEIGGDVRGQAPSIGDMARDNVSQSSGSVHPYSGDQSAPSWDALNKLDLSPMMIDDEDVPDLIDAALRRPGRFNKLLYVGVATDPSYRERVLKALTRKFKLHEDVSLYSIAKKCPPNFTGADMYALCADAWFHAAKRLVLAAEADPTPVKDEVESVVVEYEDLVLRELSPSLSLAELKKYEQLRDQFEGTSSK
ncbi:peroxisome biogenesis protein 6 [Tanacetum coccineum]